MALDGAAALRFGCSTLPHLRNHSVSFRTSASFRNPASICSDRSELQLKSADFPRFFAALSLGAAAAVSALSGEQKAFACPQTSVSCEPQKRESQHKQEEDVVMNSQEADCSDGATMNEDVQRAFEKWKTVPYALSFPFRIVGLRGSVPPAWIKDFMLLQGKKMRLGTELQGSLDSIYTQLSSVKKSGQVTSRSIMAADVVTMGDSWLGGAISNELIVPVGRAEDLDWFHNLHPKWQAMLQRDSKGRPNKTGDVWGAPYRCGCMVVAYRKDKLRKAGVQAIEDWEDLWRPELAGRISMIDSTREVVGLVLKSLGASYNTRSFDNEVEGGQQAVQNRLRNLRKQVRVFDNVNYLKALGAGDVWVAVGWSTDVLPFAKRTSNVGVMVPASGTSLWADVWVVPATTKLQSDKVGGRTRGPCPLVFQWLDFCLQPARSLAFQESSTGASPLRFCDEDDEAASRQSGPELETNLVWGLPPKKILEKSEFLEPVSEEVVSHYINVLT